MDYEKAKRILDKDDVVFDIDRRVCGSVIGLPGRAVYTGTHMRWQKQLSLDIYPKSEYNTHIRIRI